MKPPLKKAEPIEDMFRSRLENIIHLRHPLAVLASRVDWARLKREFAACYSEEGRPCRSG